MRNQIIINSRAEKLKYEIREIVSIAKQIEALGQEITWENIGDPVQKGEDVPDWLKKIVQQEAAKDSSYAYAPTKGLDSTREFLAKLTNERGGIQITKEDIIFFNGLGDAVGKIYGVLAPEARIIGPSPAYPTHSSAEASHSGSAHLTYELDPQNNWLPDLNDLRKKIASYSNIVGILLINPNNPTGAVCQKNHLEEIVKIAKEFNLFIIADEIYINMVYTEQPIAHLSDVIADVCAISMKGISKEFPWPGSRCGWLEFYNLNKDENFRKYFEAIFHSKMLEVSSTTLPQAVIPKIMSDLRYQKHLRRRNNIFKERAESAYSILKTLPEIIVSKPEAAFYLSAVFKDRILKNKQKLNIKNEKIRNFIKEKVSGRNFSLDKRFVYHFLGATGICLVPLTGFETKHLGFRITLLETDKDKFERIFKTVKEKIRDYINS